MKKIQKKAQIYKIRNHHKTKINFRESFKNNFNAMQAILKTYIKYITFEENKKIIR